LRGELSNTALITEAYLIYWLCVDAFQQQQRGLLNHRPLFESVLGDLLVLARQDEAQRWRALAVAWRYAARYALIGLLLPAFWNFAAKIIAPPSWRRLFRHAVPRESNA
jgi:hypothetical protein